ncbi:unnamed protein product [Vitrella brassicaformis CCMP3155]|uniref:Leucine zipper transcription factor-like protein 1 n=2 Tax=Vitrella brassicaformis TaxID=1169539 RepID=A0A0G4EP95_VITBC|nr:unnamed protein product [Vitrella brassicaformis CCMP3155]|eukprot:CEL99249.1 unnamed protein product [Vitrella brassicaformis CCMP3155]
MGSRVPNPKPDGEEKPKMELSESHREQLQRYLLHCKGRRDRFIKEVTDTTDDVKDERCIDDVFTKKDAEEMLGALSERLKELVREELESLANLSGVVFAQLCTAAQQQAVQLSSDTALAEDQHRVQEVAALGEAASATAALKKLDLTSGAAKRGHLPVLGAAHGASGHSPTALHELQEARDQNQQLIDRQQQMQQQLSELLKERSAMGEELDKVKGNFKILKKKFKEIEGEPAGRAQMEEIEKSLNDTKALLSAKDAALADLQADQQRRLSESAPVKQLKSMLQKKNEEIKSLRQRLKKHEDVDQDAEQDSGGH